MKYIRTYEGYSYDIKYQDDNIRVTQLAYGINSGKIQFRIQGDLYSMMYGCFKILGTKYENEPEIRSIKIWDRWKNVTDTSKSSIIREVSKEIGYPDFIGMPIMYRLESNFSNEIQRISEVSNNLGEMIDRLKILKAEMIEFEKDYFEEWKLEHDAKKYNL